MLLLAAACTGDTNLPGTGPDVTTDSSATQDSEITWPDETHGVRPDDPLPLLADFSATNRDGSARGPEDLRDGPTVIWFFPWADTPG